MSLAETFAEIYARNEWNGTETPSGPGSTQVATADIRVWLPLLIHDLGAHAVLDAGCGTAAWMPDLPGYVGVDIVPAALEAARVAHPTRRYVLADICTDTLPFCDVVICRDALQHLSWEDAARALENFRRAGAAWLVATTHVGERNRPIGSGRWHPVNMQAPPFSMGEPYGIVFDGTWDTGTWRADKYLGAWPL